MKKTVLLIALYLLPCISKADWFPSVQYISSKDSTVWVLVSTIYDFRTYKIDIDRFGKIVWKEETDTVLCNNMVREYNNSWKDTLSAKKRWNSFDKDGCLWKIEGTYLYFTDNYDYNKIKIAYELPISGGILHVGDNGKVWWGIYSFFGYYQKCQNRDYQNYFYGEGVKIFFIDEYATQGSSIYLCKEGEDCLEEQEPEEKDYDNLEDYHTAMSEYLAEEGGDGYPQWLCFCDGRKIGYIKDSDGFVNFRTVPDISAPIIGIILDRVRVFYWDNENNGDWYRVEINGIEGYVQKSKVIIKNEENV
jgi:hypothetical protein